LRKHRVLGDGQASEGRIALQEAVVSSGAGAEADEVALAGPVVVAVGADEVAGAGEVAEADEDGDRKLRSQCRRKCRRQSKVQGKLMSTWTSKNRIGGTNTLRYRRIGVIAMLMSGLFFAAITFTGAAVGQQSFGSPSTAAAALVAAAKNDDMNALASILGSEAKEILSSGDPVADNKARDDLVAEYNEMHRLAYDEQGRVILYLGSENWPLPIPLVKKDGRWIFDTASGKKELLYRRIGRNELFTIGVLEDLADAQEDYASEARFNGVKQFAQKIISDEGERNGLYWPAAEGQARSPIGPLIASATAEGYKKQSSAPIPFHGYYYKVLTRQGKNAPEGAKNYLVNGKMTKGFAFLAYPAEYRSSGVMTFMINQDGVVVQKDLGPKTAAIASQTSEFNPDKSWDQVVE
jgi:hypothetical protein